MNLMQLKADKNEMMGILELSSINISGSLQRPRRLKIAGSFCLMVSLCASLAIMCGPARAAKLPIPPTPYNYTIIDQDIKAVLRQFASQLGVRTNIDASIEGRVVDEKPEGTPQQFLNKLADQYNFEWYYDGLVLHVTPSQATVSRVVTLNVVSLDRLVESLRALEIYDERFPIKPTPNSDVALVTGPPRFVSLVESSVAALAETTPTPPQPDAVNRQVTVRQTPQPVARPPRPLVVYRGSSVQVLRGANVAPEPVQNGSSSTAEEEATPEN